MADMQNDFVFLTNKVGGVIKPFLLKSRIALGKLGKTSCHFSVMAKSGVFKSRVWLVCANTSSTRQHNPKC